MFGIGKRTVVKVLKDRPSDFIDLSSLAHRDIDQSVYAAGKLVARLYDQKGKLKPGHVELNKLRVGRPSMT
jgi:dephospho-CoA kinase